MAIADWIIADATSSVSQSKLSIYFLNPTIHEIKIMKNLKNHQKFDEKKISICNKFPEIFNAVRFNVGMVQPHQSFRAWSSLMPKRHLSRVEWNTSASNYHINTPHT